MIKKWTKRWTRDRLLKPPPGPDVRPQVFLFDRMRFRFTVSPRYTQQGKLMDVGRHPSPRLASFLPIGQFAPIWILRNQRVVKSHTSHQRVPYSHLRPTQIAQVSKVELSVSSKGKPAPTRQQLYYWPEIRLLLWWPHWAATAGHSVLSWTGTGSSNEPGHLFLFRIPSKAC